MHKRSVLAGLALTMAAAGSAYAQGSTTVGQIESDNTAFGTTAAEFLLLPATARGAALGGSFAALATDVSALYFNPAGLSQMSRPGMLASSMSYVADTRYQYVALAVPFGGGARAIGFQIGSFGFSDQPVYTVEDPQGQSGKVYSVNQLFVGATLSQQFSDRFSAGLTAKLINDRLGEVSGRAFAVDFGTSFHATVSGRAIRAAFVVSNLGTTLQHSGQALDALVRRNPPLDQDDVPQEPARARLQTKEWSLPVMFRVGLAYDAFSTTSSRMSILSEFTQPNNSEPGFNFAGEYSINVSPSIALAGRLGWTYASDNNLDPVGPSDPNYAGFQTSLGGEGSDGLSAGGGVRLGRGNFGLSFDYAYRSMGFLGGVNLVTVGVNW